MSLGNWAPDEPFKAGASQEGKTHVIRSMRDCHQEFDQTFIELCERTSTMTALYGIAFTVVARAHTTKDPQGALESFIRMLRDSFEAIQISKEKGEWKPPSGTSSK